MAAPCSRRRRARLSTSRRGLAARGPDVIDADASRSSITSPSTRVSELSASTSSRARCKSASSNRRPRSWMRVCSTVSGARSSCDASATKRRCSANASVRGRIDRSGEQKDDGNRSQDSGQFGDSQGQQETVPASLVRRQVEQRHHSALGFVDDHCAIKSVIDPSVGEPGLVAPASPSSGLLRRWPRPVPAMSRSTRMMPGGGSVASSAVWATDDSWDLICCSCTRTSTKYTTAPDH